MADPTFAELLAGCQRSALHLEMRDGYMLDDPDFIAWQNGHRLDPADRRSWWRPFVDKVAQAVERGVTVRRARIVSEPVSDYVRFEYDVTFTNMAVGEDVRWLPRRRASSLRLPGNDFWLFDGELVQFNHFGGNGNALFKEIVTNPDVIEFCAASFDAVWQCAVPHAEFHPA